jgi:putative membrane protein
MSTLANIVIAIIALMHAWFLILEMFLWDKPTGRRAFGLSPEFAAQSKVLAANQGLYNGFLAAGLIWGLILGDTPEGTHVKIFFLACIFVAGLYGGFTATRKVLWIQAAPALVALILVGMS